MNKPRIVFTTEDGKEISPEELTTVDGRFHYQLVSDTEVSEEAKDLHEKGRIAGQQEDFDRALDLFAQARELAPDWPFPIPDRRSPRCPRLTFRASPIQASPVA